ncbi:Uncharacterised protein [Klebsiella pneumoniae]|nr:Uncharacterised protein [Klebsiella pneumoniae]
MMNVYFYRVAGDIVIPAIELFLNQLTRQHASGVAHQEFQQSKLLWLERQALAVQGGRESAWIENNIAVPQLAAALAVGATHQRFQTRGDFNQRERFAEIVIGAEA